MAGNVLLSMLFVFFWGSLVAAAASSTQSQQMFEWGFSDTVSLFVPSIISRSLSFVYLQTGAALPACVPLALFVNPLPLQGAPKSAPRYSPIAPFYLGVYPLGVRGKQLILALVDGRGTSGGVDTKLYTVPDGTSSCLPSTAHGPPAFTLFAARDSNASLQTCAAWSMLITGGTPPLVLTVAATDSSDITNITLGANVREYNYTNRALPGRQMIAAASDSTGKWATGVPFVLTTGSSDITCSNTTSSSAKSASSAGLSSPTVSVNPPPVLPAITSTSKVVIISWAIGGVLVIFGCLLCIYLLLCRRARLRQTKQLPAASVVSPFVDAPESSTSPSSQYQTQMSSIPSLRDVPTPLGASAELPPPYACTTNGNRVPRIGKRRRHSWLT
ncbi:hypothetical protein MIND_00190200 [Mycena indigotica]|uniref:Membrane-associated protein n=1 Tax=Mycena indigotica TaxID=2126181 RepID=A0A8H6T7J9_9AGAR|nr:uncharacterized protein MIND_00190200 [Mycena indigotica]KAF7311797.1 hypothetical protein MIND_00190200 [Mycena indigotica]